MRAVALLALNGLAGCGRVAFDGVPGADAADAADAPDAADALGVGCWELWHQGNVMLEGSRRVDEVLGANVGDPSLADGGRRLYVWAGFEPDLYTATRSATGQPWQDVAPVVELNSANAEYRLSTSADGLVGVFNTQRSGGMDIWSVSRANPGAPFDTPVLTPFAVAAGDFDPELSADGLRVYFARESVAPARQIMRATRPARDQPFDPPVALTELESSTFDPSLSPDERVLVYTTTSMSGWRQVRYATRGSMADPFGISRPLAIDLEATQIIDPEVSDDGCEVFFRAYTATGDHLYVANAR